MSDDIEVLHEPEHSRWVLKDGERVIGIERYVDHGEQRIFFHTEVAKEHGGREVLLTTILPAGWPALHRYDGVLLVEDLLNCTRERLLAIPNFGDKALEQVFNALRDVGLACTVEADGRGRWSYVGPV